jgi:hypothetical protein
MKVVFLSERGIRVWRMERAISILGHLYLGKDVIFPMWSKS